MKQIKTTMKIAVIAMMGMSLGINAKSKLNNSVNEFNKVYLNKGINLKSTGKSELCENEDNSNIKHFNTLIGNSYVKVYQIKTKSNQLASNVRISATSHTGAHVGNFTANVLVNHHRDVFIKTISGGYTQGTIKVESDNHGSYFMSYKTTSPNQGRYFFTIEALSSEITITPLPTGIAPTGTIHEHNTNFGTHESGTGGNFNSIYEGNVGIGTASKSAKLDVNGDVSVSGKINVNGRIEDSNNKYFNTLIGNSYVKVYQIKTKSGQLASNVRISATSHTGNHVGNFTADVLVNHHRDVFIKTISGGYTQGTIKVESDNHGSYFMSYKTTSPNQGRYFFTIEALSSEITITPLPTGIAPTGTIHEHKTNFGTHGSGTGGNFNSIYKGNVGIGTDDTKGFELGVNGKIAANEVKVAVYPNWPDFVFYGDYDLPTLTEVENHIKEKGHLRYIPSAKEVEKNGFFLGEMDAKLLQKIEELTLYTIEQEKKIKKLEKQQKEIEDQRSKIERLETLLQKLLKDKN